MERAREALANEVDIIQLIRSRRFVHRALKQLLNPGLLRVLIEQSQFEEIETVQLDTPPQN